MVMRICRKRLSGPLGCIIAAIVSGGRPAPQTPDFSNTAHAHLHGRAIGLAVTGWRTALVESPGFTECGGKLDPGPVAQLKATPGALDRINTQGGTYEQIGLHGETPQYSPLAFNDPASVPELVTTTGYGMNLDGTRDGQATAHTCRHEKFDALPAIGVASGERIDNQLSRVVGCVQGYRSGGQTAEYSAQEIAAAPLNRHLILITGVDDEMNDPAVEVHIYKGLDRLLRKSDGSFLPGLSQRIDTRYPQYVIRTHAKIVQGVLITDPVPVAYFPLRSQLKTSEREMRNMSLRLRLTPDGAEGMLTGYDDWRRIWNLHTKRLTAEINKMSSSTIYRRFLRYADGYPDGAGQCTHISSAYRITAVRAAIVDPAGSEQRMAMRGKD